MKYAILLVLVISVTALAFPAFQEGFNVNAGGSSLVSGYNSSPAVTDWNGDGLNDLLIACLEDIGDEKFGTIRFYQNSGTNAEPVFDDFSYLMADGDTLFTQGTC